MRDSPEDPLWGLLACNQVIAFLQVSIWPGTGQQRAGNTKSQTRMYRKSRATFIIRIILWCVHVDQPLLLPQTQIQQMTGRSEQSDGTF